MYNSVLPSACIQKTLSVVKEVVDNFFARWTLKICQWDTKNRLPYPLLLFALHTTWNLSADPRLRTDDIKLVTSKFWRKTWFSKCLCVHCANDFTKIILRGSFLTTYTIRNKRIDKRNKLLILIISGCKQTLWCLTEGCEFESYLWPNFLSS